MSRFKKHNGEWFLNTAMMYSYSSRPTIAPSKAWSFPSYDQSPQHLEKKLALKPDINITTSAWCHLIPTSHLCYRPTQTTVHRGHQHHQLCFIQLPHHRLSGNRIHGMGALSCAATWHEGSRNGQCSHWGVWSSICSMPQLIWFLVRCTKHDIKKNWCCSNQGRLQRNTNADWRTCHILESSFCSQAARPETDQDLTDANLVQMQLLFLNVPFADFWFTGSHIHQMH